MKRLMIILSVVAFLGAVRLGINDGGDMTAAFMFLLLLILQISDIKKEMPRRKGILPGKGKSKIKHNHNSMKRVVCQERSEMI